MEKEGNQQIRKFYKKINEIDNNLMQLLTERFSIYSKIGEIKSNQGIKVFEPDHE
jgi:chorismate mutase